METWGEIALYLFIIVVTFSVICEGLNWLDCKFWELYWKVKLWYKGNNKHKKVD